MPGSDNLFLRVNACFAVRFLTKKDVINACGVREARRGVAVRCMRAAENPKLKDGIFDSLGASWALRPSGPGIER